MPTRRPILRGAAPVAALLAVALLAGACGDEPREGTIALHLTDAPYPFDLVRSTEVVVDSVTVRIGAADPDEDSGFVTLARGPWTVDLLELRHGVTLGLGGGTVPVGRVDQIRVFVGDATVEIADGRTFPLTFPSGASSGVKVFPSPPIEVVADETVDVLIDFDLSQSFSATPSAPRRAEDIVSFRFHPVLRVASLTDVGAVSGRVRGDDGVAGDPSDDVPLAGAAVVASQGGVDATSTSTDLEGRYLLMGLEPGTWTVAVSVSDGWAPDTTEVTVEAARETADVDFVLEPDVTP